MVFRVKKFEDLTTGELYEILRVRNEVFVVEQNCVYQDLDDVDQTSLHMYLEEEGKILAYLRAFMKKEVAGTVQIGRVLTVEHGKGWGGRLLHEALQVIRKRMNPSRIFLEAQCYATGYYEREGFQVCTEEFLEDGIPHVGMELKEEAFSEEADGGASEEITLEMLNERNPDIKAVRAKTYAEKAAGIYVRIAGMALQNHIPQEIEFDELDEDPNTRYMVLMDDVMPVAVCRMYEKAPGIMAFGRMIVVPAYRGRGLGSKTILEAEGWCRDLGYKKIVLEARDNAVNFYERLGFTADYSKVIMDTFRCVHMEKNMIVFRKSTLQDIDQMVKIADDGKALLKSRGINQWQRGTYPDRELFIQDVKDGIGYVLARGDEVLAVCAVTFTDEESYRKLNAGKWLTADDAKYATIHRGAVAREHHGEHLSTRLFDAVAKMAKQEKAGSVRADTHPDNLVMQGALEKAGFRMCGEFFILEGDEAGDLRYGYELIV